MHGAIHDTEVGDDAPIGVEHRVEDQSLQRRLGIAFRRRYFLNDGVKDGGDAFAGTGTHPQDFRGVASQHIDDLVFHHIHHGAVHVDLVHHGDDLKVVFQGHIEVGDGLGLDALGGVHHKEGTLASGDGTGDLVGEVHVARGVDKVQGIDLTLILILHLDSVALDGDAALTLEIHVVEHLVNEFLLADGLGEFKKTIGQGRFAMVDMGDNAEIPDVLHGAQRYENILMQHTVDLGFGNLSDVTIKVQQEEACSVIVANIEQRAIGKPGRIAGLIV